LLARIIAVSRHISPSKRHTRGEYEVIRAQPDALFLAQMDPAQNTLFNYLSKYYNNEQFSDVTIRAFETDYKLHRIILSSSTYFKTLFDPEWENSSHIYAISFKEDHFITKESFELVVRKLYNIHDTAQEVNDLKGFTATACFLDLSGLGEVVSEHITSILDNDNLAEYVSFAFDNNYGLLGDQIRIVARRYLCKFGHQLPAFLWHNLSEDLVKDVLQSDDFFVPTEWDRCQFIITLYLSASTLSYGATRLKLYSDALSKIHFSVLAASELRYLGSLKDNSDGQLVPTNMLHSASWYRMELQHLVSVTKDASLGLVHERVAYDENTDKSFAKGVDDNSTYEVTIEESRLVTNFAPFRFSVTVDASGYQKSVWHRHTDQHFYGGSYWSIATKREPPSLEIYLTRKAVDSDSDDEYNDRRCKSSVAVSLCALSEDGKGPMSYAGVNQVVSIPAAIRRASQPSFGAPKVGHSLGDCSILISRLEKSSVQLTITLLLT
jgi:hypothetical protein